jgi:hypothetical protein
MAKVGISSTSSDTSVCSENIRAEVSAPQGPRWPASRLIPQRWAQKQQRDIRVHACERLAEAKPAREMFNPVEGASGASIMTESQVMWDNDPSS